MDGRHADVRSQHIDARHVANAAIFTFSRADNNDAGFGDQSHWRLTINLEN